MQYKAVLQPFPMETICQLLVQDDHSHVEDAEELTKSAKNKLCYSQRRSVFHCHILQW